MSKLEQNFQAVKYRICVSHWLWPTSYRKWHTIRNIYFWTSETIFFPIIKCSCVKNSINWGNNSPSLHISYINIFELPVDFIPYISVDMLEKLIEGITLVITYGSLLPQMWYISPRITQNSQIVNMQIFVILADFMPNITVSVWVIFLKLREIMFLSILE